MAAHRRRVETRIVRLDEWPREQDGLRVERERHPVDEMPRENRETKRVTLAVFDELFDGIHRRVKAPMAAIRLRAVALGHAAGGIEEKLHIGELALHFRRREGHRVREKDDREREQRGGQAVRAQHEEAEHATPALAAVIEGHRDGLAAPDPFPKGENHREREQAEPLRMEKNHAVTSAFGASIV